MLPGSRPQKDILKRQLVQGAVEDHLDAMAGLTPRPLRPPRRRLALWGPRSRVAICVAALAGAAHLIVTRHADHLPPVAAATPLSAARSAARRDVPQDAAVRFPEPAPIGADVLALGLRRVVIDAGHGGDNEGTAAAGGLLEKDLTLDIADRLRTLFAATRIDAVMTREDDRSVSLQRRAELAREAQGDLFISIHLNSLGDRRTRGIETYYLGPTTDPDLVAIAAEENRESGYSLAHMRTLLDGLYADVRREESKALARAVQRELVTRIGRVNPGVPDRGIKTAPFVVLVATEMPAILAEVSCLSSDKDARLLTTADYRQALAEALFAGVQAYARRADSIDRKGEEHGS
jgi:N-acetylmuramoyl-L-alanine amidase